MFIAEQQQKQKKQIIPPPPASESEVDTSPGSQARKFQVQPDPRSLIPPLQADDDVWQLVCAGRRMPRRKVFFVGRLHASITDSQLESYIVRGAAKVGLEIQVAGVSVRSPGSQDPESRASARVSVNAVDSYMLRQPHFWVEEVYCREWRFQPHDARCQQLPTGHTNTSDSDRAEDLFSKVHKNAEPGREDKWVHVPDIPVRPDKRPHPRESPVSSCEPVYKKGGDLREITDGR